MLLFSLPFSVKFFFSSFHYFFMLEEKKNLSFCNYFSVHINFWKVNVEKIISFRFFPNALLLIFWIFQYVKFSKNILRIFLNLMWDRFGCEYLHWKIGRNWKQVSECTVGRVSNNEVSFRFSFIFLKFNLPHAMSGNSWFLIVASPELDGSSKFQVNWINVKGWKMHCKVPIEPTYIHAHKSKVE